MVIDSDRLLGYTLGTCTLQSLLGRGGMGTVYRAQQSRPRRTVAVKVLMPGLLLETKVRAEFLARFRREADAIAALDHINIIPIYEYGEQEELAYLVMPHITGGTLRNVLEKRGRLPLNEVVPIIEQAAAALDYAHARGIIHRDLKPGNILFHADGRVLLADFGLAKILNESTETSTVGQNPSSGVTSAGAVIGTPEYFSPEQSTGNLVDQRTDVYSLGVVLYQTLAGRVPFTGSTAVAIAVKHTVEEPPSLCQLNPTIPCAVEAVVMKAMAKKPEQRYASAGELARALRAAVAEDSLSQKSGSSSQKAVERTTPLTLMSEDTVLDVPGVPPSEAPTVKTASVQAPLPPWEHVSITPSPPIKERAEHRGGRQSTWMMLLGGLLAATLVIGSLARLITYIHFPGSAGSAAPVAQSSAATTHSSSTPTQQSADDLPAAQVPVGSLLYGTTLPACDTEHNLWNKSSNAHLTCNTSAMELANTSSKYLAGIFLDKLPNGYGIPNDYVLQVQVNESPGSHGGFGVFFRNQPGTIHQGAFSFLLFPQGKWEANVYNDRTGNRTMLYKGRSFVQLDGLTTIDIVVHGNTFRLYLNGKYQGNAISSLYPSGTIGFAADVGADVFFRNLAIYALPGKA